jgi:hypothetical protein
MRDRDGRKPSHGCVDYGADSGGSYASLRRGATISVNGVTFSDELGGFVLERASGQGSMDDPFVVVERMTSLAGGTPGSTMP